MEVSTFITVEPRSSLIKYPKDNNRTSKISLLQLAEFLSGTSQTLAAGNNFVTEGEYDDVGKEIILSRNDGEQIKITGFTGGQDLYTNETPVPEKVGGVEVGTTFQSKTMEEVFNMLFYPTLEPEKIDHSTKLVINHSGVIEIGTPLDLQFTNTAGGGSWTQDWQGSNLQPDNYAGEALSAKIEYTGDGTFTNINSLQITGKYGLENVGYNNYEVVEGNQIWKLTTTFAPGEDPINSDGNISDERTPFGGGELNDSKTINGAYPIYIIKSDGTFRTLTPLVSHNTTNVILSINYNGTDYPNIPFQFRIPQAFGTPIKIVQLDPFGDWGTSDQIGVKWDLSTLTMPTTYHSNVPYHKFVWVSPLIGKATFKITI